MLKRSMGNKATAGKVNSTIFDILRVGYIVDEISLLCYTAAIFSIRGWIGYDEREGKVIDNAC